MNVLSVPACDEEGYKVDGRGGGKAGRLGELTASVSRPVGGGTRGSKRVGSVGSQSGQQSGVPLVTLKGIERMSPGVLMCNATRLPSAADWIGLANRRCER